MTLTVAPASVRTAPEPLPVDELNELWAEAMIGNAMVWPGVVAVKSARSVALVRLRGVAEPLLDTVGNVTVFGKPLATVSLLVTSAGKAAMIEAAVGPVNGDTRVHCPDSNRRRRGKRHAEVVLQRIIQREVHRGQRAERRVELGD